MILAQDESCQRLGQCSPIQRDPQAIAESGQRHRDVKEQMFALEKLFAMATRVENNITNPNIWGSLLAVKCLRAIQQMPTGLVHGAGEW